MGEVYIPATRSDVTNYLVVPFEKDVDQPDKMIEFQCENCDNRKVPSADLEVHAALVHGSTNVTVKGFPSK